MNGTGRTAEELSVLQDDDVLDGCEVDFAAAPDNDETAELRALFPDGVDDQHKAAEWTSLAAVAADKMADAIGLGHN